MGVETLREHAGMWKSKRESINHIRTTDGAVEAAEEMADMTATYMRLEEGAIKLTCAGECTNTR